MNKLLKALICSKTFGHRYKLRIFHRIFRLLLVEGFRSIPSKYYYLGVVELIKTKKLK